MNDVTIIGVDLAKRVFHAHGSHSDGSVAFWKRLSRSQVLTFFAKQPRCTVRAGLKNLHRTISGVSA
jgi:transposase